MKKILVLLAVLLVAGTAFAQDVALGGWFDTRGAVVTPETGDTTFQYGDTNFEWSANVYGDGFGLSSTLGYWDARGNAHPGTIYITNTYLYSYLLDGVLKLQGGWDMKNISYAPSTIVGAVMVPNVGRDAFGRGYGKFNYEGIQTVTGLFTEIAVEGFSLGVAIDVPRDKTVTISDALQNGPVIMAKYALPDTADLYAGYYVIKDAGKLWLAADIFAVENLTAALKFEYDMATDAGMAISLNAGYDVGAVAINTSSSFELVKDANKLVANIAIVPALDMLGAQVTGTLEQGLDANTTDYGFALTLSKSVGNLTNKLELGYTTNGHWNGAGGTEFIVGYGISMWF